MKKGLISSLGLLVLGFVLAFVVIALMLGQSAGEGVDKAIDVGVYLYETGKNITLT